MKTTVLLICLILAGCAIPYETAHAEEVITSGPNAGMTKDEVILYRVRGIEAKVQKAQSDLAAIQTKYDWYVQDDAKAWSYGEEKAKEAHENAKERDVVVIAFALVVALYVGTFFAGPVMRDFPDPWNLVAAALCYLTVGLTAYGLGRLALHSLAAFLP
jgi:uncharacterized protein YcfL